MPALPTVLRPDFRPPRYLAASIAMLAVGLSAAGVAKAHKSLMSAEDSDEANAARSLRTASLLRLGLTTASLVAILLKKRR